MSILKEIRALTGLSQKQLAGWLGISKSLEQFVELGRRHLPKKAAAKLTAITLPVQALKDAAPKTRFAANMPYTNPAKLVIRHKKKQAFHLRSAMALQQQLDKLLAKHLQLTARAALLDTITNLDTELYTATPVDKQWAEMIAWFSEENLAAVSPEEQDLLRDKMEMHLAYAELHRERWERFEGMGT